MSDAVGRDALLSNSLSPPLVIVCVGFHSLGDAIQTVESIGSCSRLRSHVLHVSRFFPELYVPHLTFHCNEIIMLFTFLDRYT